MANDAAQSAIDSAGGFLPPIVYVMTLGRTTTGINKAEDTGRMDAQIMSTDASQRVFPTTLANYLEFCGWIRQETLCD